jgi:hypothetical protein
MDEREFWELKFGVEVSTIYHDWRRGTMETTIRVVKGITFIGAIFSLVTAFDPFHWGASAAVWLIAGSSIVIGCVNLLDLVADFDGLARRHEALYRRFKEIQQRIARGRLDWSANLPDWDADVHAIRADEPATLWAVYAMCWNQNIGKHLVEPVGYLRPVTWWQSLLRNIVHFRPQDFPASYSSAKELASIG